MQPKMENSYKTEPFILVFKTNIACKNDVASLAPALNARLGNLKWSVDLHDVDHVLRIESVSPEVSGIIVMLNNAGFACEELLD